MRIVVCIKQVPDTADIKWTENNTLKREGLDSVINPLDEYALETALKIKDKYPNTEITVISMGPKQAEHSLKEALAKGCDKAVIICDKKFAASDTIATATIISSAIKNNIPYDLIICGQYATDGDTAQTGPGIAEKLNLPQVTYVNKILDISLNDITVEKEGEYGIETIKVKIPALICIQNCENELRQAKINGYMFAQDQSIKEVTFDDVSLSENQVGIKGSPTYVSKAFRAETKHNIEFVTIEKLSEIIEELGTKINEQ